MMESQEQIDLTLNLAGEFLEFESGTIKGIPGTETRLVQSYDANAIEQQKFSFQVSAKDLIENEIEAGQEFTYEVFGQLFTFSVDPFLRSLEGWVELKCSIVGIENV